MSFTRQPMGTTTAGGNQNKPRCRSRSEQLRTCACTCHSEQRVPWQKLLAAVDTDGSGHIHEDEWVDYFEKHTPASRAKFDLFIAQFVEVPL